MALPARIRRPRMPAATIALAALLLCAACSKPAPPETDRPPEPQADAAQATIRQPIDRARAVQGEVDAGAAKQRADVDAQAGY
jgi:hypothetical protein